jgi:hypothetical protein
MTTYTNQDLSITIDGIHVDFPEKMSDPPLHVSGRKYEVIQDSGVNKEFVDVGDESKVPEVDIEFIVTETTKSILTLAVGSTTTLVVSLGVMTLTYSNVVVKNTKVIPDKDIKGSITLIITQDPVVS